MHTNIWHYLLPISHNPSYNYTIYHSVLHKHCSKKSYQINENKLSETSVLISCIRIVKFIICMRVSKIFHRSLYQITKESKLFKLSTKTQNQFFFSGLTTNIYAKNYRNLPYIHTYIHNNCIYRRSNQIQTYKPTTDTVILTIYTSVLNHTCRQYPLTY